MGRNVGLPLIYAVILWRMIIYIKKTVVHPRDLKAKSKRSWWKVVRSFTYHISSQVGWHLWIFLFHTKDFFFSFLFLCGPGDGTQDSTHSKPLSYSPRSGGHFKIHGLIFSFVPFWFLGVSGECRSSGKLLNGNEKRFCTWKILSEA